MLAVCDAMTPTQERAVETEHAIGEHGGDRKSEQYQHENSHVDIQLNSADYWTARIARDAPDIYNGMLQGEYRSVNAAAIEAGIVNAKTRYSLSACLRH
jgi:hypothetical protein